MKVAADIEEARGRQVAILPWRREQDGTISVLMITSRTNAKWMLPKGWPMADRSDAEAARQEALEEAGVDGDVDQVPLGSYLYIKLFADGSTKPSQAIVFSMRVTTEHSKWDEKHERRRKWFSVEDAAQIVHEPDLARFLTNVAAGRIALGALTP